MPRFFFHIDDHVSEIDEDGQELPSAAEARVQAIMHVGALLRDEPALVWDGRQLEVRVTDSEGRPVTAVHVSAIDAPLRD